MKLFRKTFIIYCLLVLFAGIASAQESILLSYKFSPGTTDRFKTTTTYSSKQIMGDQEIVVSGSAMQINRYQTESVNTEGTAVLVVSLEDMSVSVKTMGMDTTMTQKDLIGKRSQLTINRFGKEVASKALDSVDIMGLGIGVDFGTTSQMTFLPFPGKAAKPGDTWTNTSNDTVAVGEGFIITKASYTFTLHPAELKNGHTCYKISFQSVVEVSGKMNAMGMEMFVEGGGDVEGNLWFDPALGKVIADETNSGMDYSLAVGGNVNMTIPSIISVKSARSLVE